MENQDQESRNTPDDTLELNKETIRDLDLEPIDPENVKGGGLSIPTQVTYGCAVKLNA